MLIANISGEPLEAPLRPNARHCLVAELWSFLTRIDPVLCGRDCRKQYVCYCVELWMAIKLGLVTFSSCDVLGRQLRLGKPHSTGLQGALCGNLGDVTRCNLRSNTLKAPSLRKHLKFRFWILRSAFGLPSHKANGDRPVSLRKFQASLEMLKATLPTSIVQL